MLAATLRSRWWGLLAGLLLAVLGLVACADGGARDHARRAASASVNASVAPAGGAAARSGSAYRPDGGAGQRALASGGGVASGPRSRGRLPGPSAGDVGDASARRLAASAPSGVQAGRPPNGQATTSASGTALSPVEGVRTGPTAGTQSPTAQEVQEAEEALPGCRREQAGVTLAELEQEAAGPLGIQC